MLCELLLSHFLCLEWKAFFLQALIKCSKFTSINAAVAFSRHLKARRSPGALGGPAAGRRVYAQGEAHYYYILLTIFCLFIFFNVCEVRGRGKDCGAFERLGFKKLRVRLKVIYTHTHTG